MEPRQRPDVTVGPTPRLETGCGTLYVTINSDDKGPVEMFIRLGKGGNCSRAQNEALARVISLYLQEGGELLRVGKALRSIRCEHEKPFPRDNGCLSCPDGIGKLIEGFIKDEEENRTLPQGLRWLNNKWDMSEVPQEVREDRQDPVQGNGQEACTRPDLQSKSLQEEDQE